MHEGQAECAEESTRTLQSTPPHDPFAPGRPSSAARSGSNSSSSRSGMHAASPSRAGVPQAWGMRPTSAVSGTKKPEHSKLEPLDTPTNKRSQAQPIKSEAYAVATPQRGSMKSPNCHVQRIRARTPASPASLRPSSSQRKLQRVSSAPVANLRRVGSLQDQPWSGSPQSLPMKPLRQCSASATQRSGDQATESSEKGRLTSKSLRQRCATGQRARDFSQTF